MTANSDSCLYTSFRFLNFPIITFFSMFILQVIKDKHVYVDDIESREEGGTPAIVESIRAGLCFQLKQVSCHQNLTINIMLVDLKASFTANFLQK